jgi:predicted glycogen debranching enzyme
MQFSKHVEFITSPDWYYDIEYIKELERGYDFKESLFVPGYFEVILKKDEQLIFSAGLNEIKGTSLKAKFTKEMKSNIELKDFESCLKNAARQFIINHGKESEVIAGHHWFGRWGRDTFIALPGLMLAYDDLTVYKSVLDTMVKDLEHGLFPNTGSGKNASFTSVDAPLWFFWALQQYAMRSNNLKNIWKGYGTAMVSILEHFKMGTLYDISMHENHLLWAGNDKVAVTWMDAMVDGKPVTPRTGYAVEINALWYNAIQFTLETATTGGNKKFINDWENYPELIRNSFNELFYDEHDGYLADVVTNKFKDWSIRPNQLIAISLPYSPVDNEIAKSILEVTERELLTTRGLRTLSPNDSNYKGFYCGDQKNRDMAYHNGTVWPWLIGPYADAYLKIHGSEGVDKINELMKGFEDVLFENGIGTIGEIYEGNAPHKPCGAISQAWSVGELFRIKNMLKEFGKTEIEKNRVQETPVVF